MKGYGDFIRGDMGASETSALIAASAAGSELGLTAMGEAQGMASQMDAAPNVPEKRFKIGGITATVWKGVSLKGEIYFNVQIGKSYKAKDNTWKTTHSLKENEIPKAMVLLQKAYEYVMAQQANSVLN